jgi:hypothetical protein
MRSRTHRNAERRLRAARAPQELEAEQRAWQVAQTVYTERSAASMGRPRARLILALALVAIAGVVLALTPAGAAVHRWIDQTLGVRHARAALFSLPAPGQILVAGPGGAWTVAADGAKRRLGSGPEAAWSPHARYVAVTGRDQLTAVNLRGTAQWSVARPDVRSPQWFAPNGYRIAYLSGPTLRVINGDGTGDRLLAPRVARITPAWRPGRDYFVAYARADGTIVAREADSGRVTWTRRIGERPRLLAWSSDGDRLVAVTGTAALVLDAGGHQLARTPALGRRPLLDGALSPDGQELALLSDGGVTLTDLTRPRAVQRQVFTGAGLRQLAWSPDGRWLLVSWPAADQWVFIHARARPRIIAVSRIAEQFSSTGSRHGFPTLEGWCCRTAGDSG